MLKKKMRDIVFVACLALVAACKPQMSADIYTGDILEVAETDKSLEMPVRMGLPIQDEKKCGENKDKMLPVP